MRGLATRVALAGDVQWRSPTADVFRGRVEDVAHRLHRTAGHLDTAADCLDQHAHGVEQALSLLDAAGAMARSGIERLSQIPDQALAVLHALDSLGVIDPRDVFDPRWTW